MNKTFILTALKRFTVCGKQTNKSPTKIPPKKESPAHSVFPRHRHTKLTSLCLSYPLIFPKTSFPNIPFISISTFACTVKTKYSVLFLMIFVAVIYLALFSFFRQGLYVGKAGSSAWSFLPKSPKWWDGIYAPPCPTSYACLLGFEFCRDLPDRILIERMCELTSKS